MSETATNPRAVRAAEELAGRISKYAADVEAVQRDLESARRQAVQAEQNADQQVRQYDTLIGQGERVKAEKSLDEVKRSRTLAKKLQQRVMEYPARLEQLQRECETLRTAAHADLLEQEAALQRAKEAHARAMGLFNGCTDSGIRQALATLAQWQEELGIEEPGNNVESAPAELPQEQAPATRRPNCPRCGRSDDVTPEPGKPGLFRCSRPYHGVIIFNAGGQMVEQRATVENQAGAAVGRTTAGATTR